jgi:hypothetical protein
MLSPGFSFFMQSDPYVHGLSCAAEVGPSKRAARSSKIEADYWLDGFRGNHKAFITEDARYFPMLNRSLSLLWIRDTI